MSDYTSDVEELIARAKKDPEALGQLLSRYHEVLRQWAKDEGRPTWQPHLSGSDLVQETLVDAFQGFANFRGHSERELLGWLRHILRNNSLDINRRRPPAPPRQIDGGSQEPRPPEPKGDDTSPSRRLMRDERELRIARALERLPERWRIAVTLKHLQRRKLTEVAERLGCSEVAAAGLVKRGLAALRQALSEETWC